MQSILPEWYAHEDDTLAAIYKTGTIALDANVLLDLYRVNRDQREEIIEVLGSVRDRLFIPYQVALEFQRGRFKVVADNHAALGKLSEAVELDQDLVGDIPDPELRREVQKLYKRLRKRFNREVAKLRDEHALSLSDIQSSDPVRSALDELLEDENFGKQPSAELLVERKATAAERIGSKTPPGFKDSKKEDPSGDYLIWAELLDHKSEADRPLLFVTNDTKEDWYQRVNGRTLGPLPALVVEMTQQSKHPYHQTSLYQFLRFANESLGADVTETTLDTVERIAPQSTSRPVRTFHPAVQAALPSYFQQNPSGIMGAAYAGGLKDYARFPDTIKLATDAVQRQANAALQFPGMEAAFGQAGARQPPLPIAGWVDDVGVGNSEWLRTVQDDAVRNILGSLPGQPYAASDNIIKLVADVNRLVQERGNAVRIAAGAAPAAATAPAKKSAPAKKAGKKAIPAKKAPAKNAPKKAGQ